MMSRPLYIAYAVALVAPAIGLAVLLTNVEMQRRLSRVL
jgi:hypothetical protein